METPAPSGFPTYLMSPPLFVSTDEPNNAIMRAAQTEIDRDRALRQFLDLYNWLGASNLIYLLPAVPGLQDETFVSNIGVRVGETVVVSKFRSPPRKGEGPIGEAYFESLLMPVEKCPYYFEGEADLKPVTETQWIMGYGQRTDKRSIAWFADRFGIDIYGIKLTDELCYHMDCVACPLTDNHMLLAVDLIEPKELEVLERIANIIPVSTELAHAGVTNCVRSGRFLLCDSSAPSISPGGEDIMGNTYEIEREKEVLLEGVCATLGLELVLFDMSEFDKSGAALSCHIMHLTRPDLRPERSW